MSQKVKISELINLLDDPDEMIGRVAMMQLLRMGDLATEELGAIQDSADPVLRRRSHQLQSAMVIRQRRGTFLRLINDPQTDIIDGLISVHLQWFDNDTIQSLTDIYSDFAAQAARYQVEDLRQLAYFMHKRPLNAVTDSTRTPEHYCIGPVLESGSGSSIVVCALAQSVARKAGLDLKIVRLLNDFALLDEAHSLALVPRGNWQITDASQVPGFMEFTKAMVLRFATMMLFANAVNSDSFRYIHTIAQSLTGNSEKNSIDFLPYPYGDKD